MFILSEKKIQTTYDSNYAFRVFKMTNVKLIILLEFIIPTFSHYYGISSGTNLSFRNL